LSHREPPPSASRKGTGRKERGKEGKRRKKGERERQRRGVEADTWVCYYFGDD
jgi:hypothetical protein